MLGFLKKLFSRRPARPYWTMPENPNYEEILSVLDEVLKYLRSPDCEVAWSGYDSPQGAVEKIESLAARIRERDRSAITELDYEFLPTGNLQEVSISSGWADEYIELSRRFDVAIGKPT